MSLTLDRQGRTRFEQAYVAARYLLGHREQALSLGLASLGLEARRLVSALTRAERRERAVMLASVCGKLRRELERRSYRVEPGP